MLRMYCCEVPSLACGSTMVMMRVATIQRIKGSPASKAMLPVMMTLDPSAWDVSHQMMIHVRPWHLTMEGKKGGISRAVRCCPIQPS